jgi:hypothetical protein
MRLIDDPFLRAQMGLKARQRVEKLFSLKKMIVAYESLYLDLLSKAQRPQRIPTRGEESDVVTRDR